jgi:hypothetical protein
MIQQRLAASANLIVREIILGLDLEQSIELRLWS